VKTVLTLYARVLGQPLLLLRLGGLMMVILVFYQIAMLLAFGSLVDANDLDTSRVSLEQNVPRLVLGVIVFWVLYVWLTTMFAVRWHRYMLLGQSNYGFLDATFGKRGWRFVWNSFLIGLLAFVAVLPFWLIFAFVVAPTIVNATSSIETTIVSLYAAMVICLLPGLYVFGRCELVFPAIALGFAMRIRDSWDETRGRGLGIFGLLVAMSIPAVVGSEISLRIVPTEGLPTWLSTAAATFIGVFFVLITTALWASALSHMYKALGLPLNPRQL